MFRSSGIVLGISNVSLIWFGAFKKLWKLTVSFVMSVCLCVCVFVSVHPSTWNISASTRWIFMKIHVWVFFGKMPCKSVNNGYFAKIYLYVYDHISLSSSWNKKYFRPKLLRKSKHTVYVLFFFFFFLKNLAIYQIMWKNTVEPDRPQMTI